MSAVYAAMGTAEPVIAPGWLLTTVLPTRTAGICQREGTWSVIVDGPAATSRSLDKALASALRPSSASENPRTA
jgi:hypothetical protein